jgi:hypothetical protein
MEMIRTAGSSLKTAGILAVMALLIASRGLAVGNIAFADVSSAPATCQTSIQATYNNMDKSTAIENALNSPLYSQGVASYANATYNSVFQIDKTSNLSTCAQQVVSFNVVFLLYNSTGYQKGILVISESQNLAVIGSKLDTNIVKNYVQDSNNWAGYEVWPTSIPISTYVYESVAYFTQATPEYPSGGCANGGYCDLSEWVGLSDQDAGGSNHLAQDGSAVVCDNPCSVGIYTGWYETLPSGSVTCSGADNMNITGGDTMYAYTENEKAYGGSDSKYDFLIESTNDYRGENSCYAGGVSYTAVESPTIATYIVENDEVCSTACDSLAEFYDVPFSYASMYVASDSSLEYIDSYVSSGYFNAYTMQNAAGTWPYCYSTVTNVSTGSESTGGDFTETWDSSTNTPYWNSGC